MNVGIGSEAALFPEKEYIMDISFAVWVGNIWERMPGRGREEEKDGGGEGWRVGEKEEGIGKG